MGQKLTKEHINLRPINARSVGRAYIPYKIEHPKAGAEYFLRVSYTQKEKTLWADKGFEVASAQFKLPVNTLPVVETESHTTCKNGSE